MLDRKIMPEAIPLLSAALITGAVVLLGLCFLTLLGVCWICASVLAFVLVHTTSVQTLLMGGICYGLYRLAKRMLRKRGVIYAR